MHFKALYVTRGSSRSQTFFKIVGCSCKFYKFHMKTPVLESVLNKVWDLRPATLFKKTDSDTGVFLWNLWNFSEHLFYKNTSCGCFWTQKTVMMWYLNIGYKWIFPYDFSGVWYLRVYFKDLKLQQIGRAVFQAECN